jgi:predicted molibdopterin-dependent oxidoreductase YjgC
VDDEAERAEVEAVWGPVPRAPGRSTRAILEACARRDVDVLLLVGADPLVDFPDRELVRRALENVSFKVVVDIALHEYEPYADAVLPAAAFLEKSGHFTDWEGRGRRFDAVRDPVGLARPEWQIFQELSEAMGADMGLTSLDALHEEMGRLLGPRESAPPTPARPADLPAPAEGLTLFTYPLLVDDGRLSVDARELKEALQREPFVEVAPRCLVTS